MAVLTTTETLTVDGVVLNTLAKNISSLTGRLRTPPIRGANIVIPGRHGSMRPSRRDYGDNTITLPMWIRGCDDDGNVPGGSSARKEFYKRADELVALFSLGKSALVLQHTMPDGTVRQCKADVLDSVDISSQNSVKNGEPLGLFVVTLTMADPFWEDTADITQNASGAASGLTDFASFAGATAPMEDMVIRFTGPINNPIIKAVDDGTIIDSMYATYQDNFASGQWLEFNCATWTWTTGGGLGAFGYGKWAHAGQGKLFRMFPHKQAGTPKIWWSGGGTQTGTTQLRVVGRRKYLAG